MPTPGSDVTERTKTGRTRTRGRAAAAATPVRRVEDLDRAREQLRIMARVALGVGGGGDTPPLRRVLADTGTGWYPLVALGLLLAVDQFQSYGFLVLGPEIRDSLGISTSALGAAVALKTVAVMAATLPMAAAVQRVPRRAVISVATGLAWSVLTMATGLVTSLWMLVLILVLDGATTGSVGAVHTSLLSDSYPPEARLRALSVYRGADAAGNVIAPLIVALVTGALGMSWRGAFVAMGLASLAAAIASTRLRDPGYGHWDTARVRAKLQEETATEKAAPADDGEASLGFFEIVQRLSLLPTVRRLLTAYAVLGMLLVPLNTYLFFFLEDDWGMGPGERGLFYAVMPIFSVLALWWAAPRCEAMFRRDPGRLVTFGAVVLAGGVVALASAIFMPVFVPMVALFGVAFALFAVLTPILNTMLLSVVPSRMRPHASALAGIFLAAVGGFGGLVLLGGIDRRFGTAGAIASLSFPGLAAAWVLHGARTTVGDDLDRMVDELVEAEELRSVRASGVHLPMLTCRGVSYSYGRRQVLFDVDFTVDDGEMVALLGTNGAGKSTLLRVVSGLGLPSRGTIRFEGVDITFQDAERRVALGIAQVPGGRAVFGPLSVHDNLRAAGYSLGSDRRAVDRGIEESFAAFPRLYERRNQPASALSGGEQQMLGLAKALILRPRLLVIDELSLGLAPKVVGELLDMVRRINAGGTAVVLVEQSVNIALSLVEHAYFMEKGEVRFDGKASELLGRTDLLRSVFLEGASQGLRT